MAAPTKAVKRPARTPRNGHAVKPTTEKRLAALEEQVRTLAWLYEEQVYLRKLEMIKQFLSNPAVQEQLATRFAGVNQ